MVTFFARKPSPLILLFRQVQQDRIANSFKSFSLLTVFVKLYVYAISLLN